MKTVAEQWEVEWTTDVPIVDGDAEVDAGTVNTRAFKTKAAALRFAKTVIEQDFWGCPCVSLMRLQIVNCNDGGPPMRDWFCVETVEVE